MHSFIIHNDGKIAITIWHIKRRPYNQKKSEQNLPEIRTEQNRESRSGALSFIEYES